jgi:hypothetical protein
MKKKASSLLLLTVLLVGLCLSARAQFGQTGALNGTVSDAEGAPLPGVAVTIKSSAIILPEMNTVTNPQGIYRFPSLPPGTYEITFVLDGMNTLVRQGILISAGQTTTVDVTLELKTLQETVVVVGQSPTVDVQSTTHTTSLDKDFISSIPAPRMLDSYFNMAPGVVAEANNPNGPMSSSHGSGVRDNAFTLDGVNVSQEDVGTQRIEVGLDIMEELSVQSGGLPAEYGDTMGTIVNVVTKSGGNRFSGSVSFYYNSEKLQSSNTEGTPLVGRLSGYKYIYEPGATLGGPVVKDRLWFFLNLSFNKRAVNIAGFPYDKAQTVPAVETRPYPYLKFTFQPSQKNKLILSYNYANLIQDNAGAAYNWSESSTVKWDAPFHVFNLQWTNLFSDSLFMDFKVGYMSGEDNLRAKGGDPLYIELTTGNYSGNYPLTDLYTHGRLQVIANATHFNDDLVGSHEFKAGAEYQRTWASRDFRPVRDPRNELAEIFTYGGVPLYGVWLSDCYSKEATSNVFAFVQDTWQPVKRLNINLGLRFSHRRSIIPAQNESEGPITFLGVTFNRSVAQSFTPIKRTDLEPRLGIAYDLTGDRKTLLKASYSRYTQANVIQYFTAASPNSIWDYVQLLFPDFTPIPGAYIAADYPNPGKVGYGGQGLDSPRTDEFTAALERELFPNWSLALRYIRKWDRDLLEDVDASQLDIDRLVNDGALEWTNWTQVTATDPFDGQGKTFWSQNQIVATNLYLLNPPGAKRDYNGFEITLNRRFARGWSMMASYVWQKSTGLIGTDWFDNVTLSPYYNNPNAHTNAIGELPLSRRHQFKFQGMVRGPWGINVSAFFRYISGGHYTRQINSLDLGVPLNQGNATIYAEERGSRALPALTILDLRLEKSFRFPGFQVGLFADLFNIFNANEATGVQTVSSSAAITFEEMTGIQDPRIFRLGAKLEF